MMKVLRAVCAVTLMLFFSGCGLDTFYYLDAPEIDNYCEMNEESFNNLYVSFQTAETTENNSLYLSSSSDFSFKGTALYYRIYDSTSAITSFKQIVDSLNSETSYASAAERIISANYKPLSLSGTREPMPLVPQTGTNRYVYVRLCRGGGTEDDFAPAVRISNDRINVSTEGSDLYANQSPCRSNGQSFEFGKENVALPLQTDEDCSLTASSADIYYVDLYAFSVGQDTTFARSYSNAVHVGTIPISVAHE